MLSDPRGRNVVGGVAAAGFCIAHDARGSKIDGGLVKFEGA